MGKKDKIRKETLFLMSNKILYSDQKKNQPKTFLLILTRIFYEIDSEVLFLGLLKSSRKLFLL